MGLLSDFFLATEAEVQSCSYEDIDTHFPVLQYKNLDPVVLLSLEGILLGTDLRPGTGGVNLSLARDFGQEGPWIYPVRPTLVAALSTLTSPRLEEVAAAWAKTEEFARASDPTSGLTELLQELSAFVRQTAAQGKRLYVKYVV
ncbi:MAG TPA: hypothetical protein VKY74_05575 [Chloroflexia bacterium]|nr:hypothetical protein [Chloroflexia bacterium]